MKSKLWTAIVAVMAVFILVASTGCTTKYTQEEVAQAVADAVKVEQANAAVEQAEAVKKVVSEKETLVQSLRDSLAVSEAEKQAIAEEKAAIEAEKVTLETAVVEAEEVVEEAKVVEENSYLLDELALGATDVSKTILDREIEKLFDSKVEFDGDDYDAEEVFTLTNLIIATNKEDFGSDVYLEVPTEALKYEFKVASDLDTSSINEDETLKFSFLGEEVEVSEWTNDSVIFTKGSQIFVTEGDTVTVDGITFEVKVINDNYVYITYDGESKKIDEEDTETIEGVDFRVVNVLDNDEGADMATLEVGTEVEVEVESGDDYAKNSPWEWVITSTSIGIVNSEEYTSIDEDEEYKSLGKEGVLSIPNGYLSIKFNGMVEEDVEDYTLDTATKDSSEYVKVKGKIVNGIEDYDRVYINSTGIYDNDLELIDNTTVELGDTDLELVVDGVANTITIDDIVINLAVDNVKVDGVNISTKDEDYLTNYGIVIDNLDDSLDDNKVKLSIPEKEIEASLTIFG